MRGCPCNSWHKIATEICRRYAVNPRANPKLFVHPFSSFSSKLTNSNTNRSYIFAALAVTAGIGGGALLLSHTASLPEVDKILGTHEDDEEFMCRFEGPGRYYAGIDEDWILYSSVLWSNVLKAWFKVYLYEVINFNIQRIWDWMFPWERSKSDDPWILLELTKSTNFWIRQMGVASLANKKEWDSYKYRTVAQACSHRTTVALARYSEASDLFFLPPPKVIYSQKSIVDDLRSQVSKLPLPPSLKSAIYYYRHAAIESGVKYQKDPLAMDTMTQFYSMPWEEEKKENRALQFCLQALLCYTAVQSYARMFVENHGLAVLLRLQAEDTDVSVTMFIAGILCNLSLDPTLLDEIVSTGWVNILRLWSRSSNTALSVLALTTLANLDRDWMTKGIYQDMLLLHPTHRDSQQVTVDIVFVHGLRGGAVKTWRQRDNMPFIQDSTFSISSCWPKDWLANDCPSARILSIGYSSALLRWGDHCPYEQDRRTLEGRSKDLARKLQQAGVGTRPIIWVGHSMGGLLIKQLLELGERESCYSELASWTSGVLFYSVPHRGSALVDIMMSAKYLLFPSVEVQEMNTSSEKLRALHERFLTFMTKNKIPCLSFGENIKTPVGLHLPDVWIISPESSNPGVGQFVCLPVNHINTCKPSDQNDIIYQRSRQFFRDVMRRAKSKGLS